MQRCPKCNRTYQDDSQKFCTFDGGRLMVDTDAPTTLDLGPAPQTDPLGATVMGPAPDLNKTVAGSQPPLTSEIPPTSQTGPTSVPPRSWSDAPTMSQPPLNAEPSAPVTTSPLVQPPSAASQSTTAASSAAPAASNMPTVATSAPQPQAVPVATPSVPTSAPRPAPAAPKSNRMLLVVGGMAVLLLLVIAGGVGFYFFVMKPKAATTDNSGSSINRTPVTTASTNANSGNANTGVSTTSQPPVEAPPNSTKFANSRDKLSGSLAEHFVGFSLYYPNDWTVDSKAGTSGSSNFFKANRMLSDDTGDYLLESAAVSWYQSNGTMQLDRPIFPNRVEFFNNLFSKDYPNYQKVSEGETKFNGYDAYQFTFKSLVKDTGKGNINLWGRVLFLPADNEDARNGIVLLTLASSAAPEIKSEADVGEKGELPVILKTFRLGSSQ